MDTLILLLQKLTQIVDTFNTSYEKKKELYVQLVDAIFKVSIAKTVEKNPQLKSTLESMDQTSLQSEVFNNFQTIFDEQAQTMFVQEVKTQLDEYIASLSASMDEHDKQLILGIWNKTP